MSPKPTLSRFWKHNGLSVVFLLLTLFTLAGQAVTGYKVHNQELKEELQLPEITFYDYLTTGHFAEAVFENWESEFLQMALYVIFTVWLYQKGSSESKDPDGENDEDREPVPGPEAPWPVNRGGWVLKLYKNSLGLAFIILFLVSFFLHARGGWQDENLRELAQGKPLSSYLDFISSATFWFQSLQNWQSEFLSVLSIVILSIYLRHKGSPESKPVDAPHHHTGR